MNYARKDLIDRLRAAYGYTVLEAQRTVDDHLAAMRDLIEKLVPGERLILENIGSLQCNVDVRPMGEACYILHFKPSTLLAAHLRARTLPSSDSRVIAARTRFLRQRGKA